MTRCGGDIMETMKKKLTRLEKKELWFREAREAEAAKAIKRGRPLKAFQPTVQYFLDNGWEVLSYQIDPLGGKLGYWLLIPKKEP